MSPLDYTLFVEEFQIFADGDLRNAKMPRQLFDQDSSVPLKDRKDFTAAFLVEHSIRRHVVSICFEYWTSQLLSLIGVVAVRRGFDKVAWSSKPYLSCFAARQIIFVEKTRKESKP